ncbi:MAG TPA: hypothetical protein VF469_28105 [Kofleriaceae bacterium]
MTNRRLALAIVLAGCGRVGFQDVGSGSGGDGGGGGTGDTITLVLASDASSSGPAGTPLAGATVLIERAGGTDRIATDATGTAQFSAAGVVAWHVAIRQGQGWRIYTMVGPPSGTIELGRRPDSGTNHTMTFVVPDNGSSSFWLHLPEACGFPPKEGSATFTLGYDPACEGKTTRVIAFTRPPNAAQDRYLDAGAVTLTSGATRTVTGSYAALPTYPIQVSNLPSLASSVGAGIYARTGLDLTLLGGDFASATPQGGAATVSATAAPGGNALWISTQGNLPIQYSSSSDRIVPSMITAQTSFDARTMVPLFDSLVLTRPPTMAWTGGEGQGTILAVEITSGQVQWDAYLAPSATSVTFPALPADLGAPVPQSFDFASVARLDIPGATTADLVPTIDRAWPSWPNDPTLFPAAGAGMARIVYSIGLGPP